MDVRNSLAKVWTAWKRFGRAVGDFIGRIVLTVFYFTIFVPFGVGVRAKAAREEISDWAAGLWITRSSGPDDLNKAKRLF